MARLPCALTAGCAAALERRYKTLLSSMRGCGCALIYGEVNVDNIELMKKTEILIEKFMEDTADMPLEVVLSATAYMVGVCMHCAPNASKDDLLQAFRERALDAHRYISESCNDRGDGTLQ